MLQRITAPGTQYSQAFVQEFKIFTQELRDFFNAGSLADMLEGIKPAMDEPDVQVRLMINSRSEGFLRQHG